MGKAAWNGLMRPACWSRVRRIGAIDALKACRGIARFRRGPRRLAARSVPPARGTIPPDHLAWPRGSCDGNPNPPAAKTFLQRKEPLRSIISHGPSESLCRESKPAGSEDVPAKQTTKNDWKLSCPAFCDLAYRIHQRNKFPWLAFGGGHHGLDPSLLGSTHFAAIVAASAQSQPKRSQHFADRCSETRVAHSKRQVSLNFAPQFPNATEYKPEHASSKVAKRAANPLCKTCCSEAAVVGIPYDPFTSSAAISGPGKACSANAVSRSS